jgi:uncharacterized membrane protein
MVRLLLPLALLFSGFAAGGLIIASLGGAPLLLSLPSERYVPIHQFLVTRFDPFMPISMCSALLLDTGIAVVAPNAGSRALALTGALLLVGAMVVSLTRNVPINRWVATLDPQRLPDDWERIDPRVRWRNWNLIRTSMAVAALVANVSTVAVLL